MCYSGVALTPKNCVFLRKKSRLRKSENAVRLLYAKNSDLTHQNAFSLFVFLHPPEKVCRALAVGLNILDFHRPLSSPSHPGEGMLVTTYCWWRNQKGKCAVCKPARSWPGQILGKSVLIVVLGAGLLTHFFFHVVRLLYAVSQKWVRPLAIVNHWLCTRAGQCVGFSNLQWLPPLPPLLLSLLMLPLPLLLLLLLLLVPPLPISLLLLLIHRLPQAR